MKANSKPIQLPLLKKSRARKTDNPKNARRQKGKQSSPRPPTPQETVKKGPNSAFSKTNILEALDDLRAEHEEAHNGYRRTLYRIIADVVDHGARLREENKLWAKFRAAEFWQGKPPKRQEEAVRYALQWVFDQGEASLYWRGVKRLVENGLRGKSLVNAIRRGGGVRKLADKAAKEKLQKGPDDEDASGRSRSTSPLTQRDSDMKRSDMRRLFVLVFRFQPEDEKKFPYKDGSRINVVGVFNAKTMEVDVDSWEKL